jgi:septum formation protein
MKPSQPRPLVLASTSPQRAELLREAGYDFSVAPPRIEEPDERHPHVDPCQYAESLAYFKARSVAASNIDRTILSADTITYIDNDVIGKPADEQDARRILKRLSGTTHQVITGVALLFPARGRRLMQHDISTIHMRPLSDETIDNYMKSGEWQGKAGAYGIQDCGDKFVERAEGSFTNIVGLPMELVAKMFASWR